MYYANDDLLNCIFKIKMTTELWNKKWKDLEEVGLTEKTKTALASLDVNTMAEFDLIDVSGMAEVRAAGVSLGQANLLRSLLNRHRRELDGTAAGDLTSDYTSLSTAGAHTTDNVRSNAANLKDMLDRKTDTDTPHTDADMDTLLNQLSIKDIRQHPEQHLEHAGKLWDFLLDKPHADPLMNAVPGEAARDKTGYVNPAAE